MKTNREVVSELIGVDITNDSANLIHIVHLTKKILCFTNKKVEYYNRLIEGTSYPLIGSLVYIDSLKKYGTVTNISSTQIPNQLTTPRGIINAMTKYNPMATIEKLKGIMYLEIDSIYWIACYFGSYNAKVHRDTIAEKLVAKNKANKPSKKEYKLYKTVNDYVCTADFIHATTIHKSQGSEYDIVYIDYRDLRDNSIDSKNVNRLLYVALSRAKKQAYIKVK